MGWGGGSQAAVILLGLGVGGLGQPSPAVPAPGSWLAGRVRAALGGGTGQSSGLWREGQTGTPGGGSGSQKRGRGWGPAHPWGLRHKTDTARAEGRQGHRDGGGRARASGHQPPPLSPAPCVWNGGADAPEAGLSAGVPSAQARPDAGQWPQLASLTPSLDHVPGALPGCGPLLWAPGPQAPLRRSPGPWEPQSCGCRCEGQDSGEGGLRRPVGVQPSPGREVQPGRGPRASSPRPGAAPRAKSPQTKWARYSLLAAKLQEGGCLDRGSPGPLWPWWFPGICH